MASILSLISRSSMPRVTALLLLVLVWSSQAHCGEIHKAAKKGDVEKVKKLLKGNPDLVFSKDEDGWTPLHLAAANGHRELAEVLLTERAEVNAKDNNGSTPLHQAAAAVGNHADLVGLLLSHGADVNVKDKFGLTPLHYATLHDNESSAEVLLAHGADVNAKDDEVGDTPLIIAAGKGYEDVTELLLAKGADVNARDNRGTPLAWAIHTGHDKIADLLRQQGGHE